MVDGDMRHTFFLREKVIETLIQKIHSKTHNHSGMKQITVFMNDSLNHSFNNLNPDKFRNETSDCLVTQSFN